MYAFFLFLVRRKRIVKNIFLEGLFDEEFNDINACFSDISEIKDVVGGWGKATPSLNEIATLSGIPGKMDVDGEEVAFLWLDGKLDIKGNLGISTLGALPNAFKIPVNGYNNS